MSKKKIIIAIAPVAHMEKKVPDGLKNPVLPEDIASEVIACAEAGASLVHLHVRDERGMQVGDLRVFSHTIDLIRAKTDIVIQGSTGGLSTLTLEERSVSVDEPRVQMASLNMGSTNFGENVYINTWPDIRYWATKMTLARVVPELEIFDLSMIESVLSLTDEGFLRKPLHFNFSLGFKGALSAKADNLFMLKSALPRDAAWSLIHEGMTDFSLIATAIGCGASGVRVGYEDGFFLEPGLPATNVQLVKKAVALAREMGYEVATPQEARKMLDILK
ncbi:MAG TPA: 3-keto-5-aminohexanoate cleavage protein [Spirochaetaceae bacterium]|nr:3-keto-5-aminohexanoate cleavage protein [Spirochaetaceae bacterium]